jgi:hypothetical protein
MRMHQIVDSSEVRRAGARLASVAFLLPMIFITSLHARLDGPLAAHVEVTPLNAYSGGKALPKPQKILVYRSCLSQ